MDAATVTRLRAEYLEMPGLCLTPEQAQRLFGVGHEQCRAALSRLVDEGVLRLTARGQYVRQSAA